MEFLKIDDVQVAFDKLLACAGHMLKVEEVAIENALGKVVAKDLFANEDLPNFRKSSVDGYAVLYNDTASASDSSPVFLSNIGKISIGEAVEDEINSGQCIDIPTGGMLPKNANAIVMMEYTEVFGSDIAINEPVAMLENVVEIGDDIKKGNLLIKKGKKITPQDIGALAAMGITVIPTFKALKIGIISTGNELVHPNANVPMGKIRDISSYSIAALAKKSSMDVIRLELLQDDIEIIQTAMQNNFKDCDIVAISGGSSYGKADLTAKIISKIADPGIFTHGIAIKPGKPTILAYDSLSDTAIIGLPGHPVSAMVVFELLVIGFIKKVTNQEEGTFITAKLTVNIPSDAGKLTFYPCVLKYKDNEYKATPISFKSSLITSLTKADGYFLINKEKEGLKENEIVKVILF